MRAGATVRVALLCYAMLLCTGPCPAAAVVKKKPAAKKPTPKSPSSASQHKSAAGDGWKDFEPDPLPDVDVQKTSVKFTGASFVPRTPSSYRAAPMELEGAAPMGTAPVHMPLWHQELESPLAAGNADPTIVQGAKAEVSPAAAPPVRVSRERASACGWPVTCVGTVSARGECHSSGPCATYGEPSRGLMPSKP